MASLYDDIRALAIRMNLATRDGKEVVLTPEEVTLLQNLFMQISSMVTVVGA